jgi:lipopolysaccharide biosynthesis glycosyltransferase
MKNKFIFFFIFIYLNNFINPIKTNNSIIIVLAVNNNYVPYVSVMIESIIQNAKQKRLYKIYILTTNISLKNKENLNYQIKNDKRFSIYFINVTNYIENKKLNTFAHLTIETYFRFLIFDLFPNSKKVLYLDSDLIINYDISELYDINIEGKYLAAVKDIDTAGSLNYQKEKRNYINEIIGCKGDDEYFQAGVILFNILEIKNKISSEILFYIAQERKWDWMDQDVLNFVFKGKIYYLNQKWNCIMNWVGLIKNKTRIDILKLAPKQLFNEYLEARKNPLIIHYAGNQKPWEYPSCDFSNYFWKYANHSIYIKKIIIQNKKKRKKRKNQKLLIKYINIILIISNILINLIIFVYKY